MGKIFSVAQMLGIPVTNWSEIIDLPSSDKHTERSLTEQNITEEDFQKFCEFMSHSNEDAFEVMMSRKYKQKNPIADVKSDVKCQKTQKKPRKYRF